MLYYEQAIWCVSSKSVRYAPPQNNFHLADRKIGLWTNLGHYPDEPKHWTLVDEYPDTEAKNKAYDIIKRLSEMDFAEIGAQIEDKEPTPFLRYAPEAQELFYEWLTELEIQKLRGTTMEPMMAEHLGKYRKLMPSLSLIFHLIDAASGMDVGNGVSLQAAERAAAWCEYASRAFTHAVLL